MLAHRIFGFNRISAFYAGVIAAPSQLIAEDLVVTALGLVAEPHHPADCAHAARSQHLVHGCVSAVLHVRESLWSSIDVAQHISLRVL